MAYAMSEEKVEEEFLRYGTNSHRFLYVAENEAFIGIELKAASRCEIRHIAVAGNSRSHGLGSRMIDEVARLHGIHEIFAETDRDAVGFYRKTGFKIKSLGEKYPGRERFYCAKTLPSKWRVQL
ncbi:GNAT family N-acetyltransferase [Planococcus salinarum]|nr:GNAT family N-acetyltransferase [Planococcus salinarum]